MTWPATASPRRSGWPSSPARTSRRATLDLRLNATGRSLLTAAHGHLKATLHLTITDPGASPEQLTVHTVIVR